VDNFDAQLVLNHPLNWIATHCRIVNKAGIRTNLKCNTAQMLLMQAIEWFNSQSLPIRILILKARQQGMTTWGLGYMYERCNNLANRYGLMSAHDDDQSTEIFRKIQLFEECNPDRRPTDYSTRKEVTYAQPHGSSLLVKTAGKENLGRGSTIHHFHGSEVAFWSKAKSSLLSVLQCIPKLPGTSVILETTANGVGGEFYDRWQKASKGEGNYYALFLPWWSFPEYVAPITERLYYTAIEEDLLSEYDLTDEQLQWRTSRPLCWKKWIITPRSR